MRIALVQSALRPESHDAALDAVACALARAAGRGARLVLFPELAFCGYGDWARVPALALPAGALAERLAPRAAAAGAGLCLGFAEAADGALFNALLLVGPDGRRLGLYRKTHLWGAAERALFRPGDGRPPVVGFDGVRLGMLICYDLDMPEAARDLARRGAEVLLVASATGADYRIVPEAVVPARAYENGVHLAFCNHAGGADGAFCGLSRLVAPDGAVLASAPGAAGAVIAAEADPRAYDAWRRAHPCLRDLRSDLFPVPAHGGRRDDP